MQPPISVATILQNRYRVLSVIGQGGFGRTYLAEDLGRFNERCALKEFIPPQGSAYALNKARELFQREAEILYQIQHPQIPQFRATFEESQRLFLVQDYVEGKTYRALLNERKADRSTFSETEVLQLMQQILPVLSYIHGKGIIHRDIAPDNIMLRQQDNLPVLIDFGVVKEIATRVQSPESQSEPTTVGKFGYAPSEQMQTGRAYPSSDLYSLAVTVLVLLTGQEPQELYDDRSLTWQWQRWTNIRPEFAQILTRMLSYRPSDRYQSASEVLKALQPLTGATASPVSTVSPTSASPFPTPVPPPAAARANSDVSQMQTMAIGRQPAPLAQSSTNAPVSGRRAQPVIPSPNQASTWDNPLALIATAIGLSVVAGITTWAIVSALRNPPQVATSPTPSPTVTPTPSPTASASSTPTPTPTTTPSSQPIDYNQRLDLKPNGETTTAEGNLRSNETITYVIPAEQGQTLNASLTGEGALLTVLGPDGKPADDKAERIPTWQGALNTTGDYLVRVSPVKGVSSSDYKLNLSLQAAPTPTPTPSPTSTSSPTPSPTAPANPVVDTQPLDLPIGAVVPVKDQITADTVKRYQVLVRPGQVLDVAVEQGNVRLEIRYPDGRLVENASGVKSWSGKVAEPGKYQIDVLADQPTDFVLQVGIDPH